MSYPTDWSIEKIQNSTVVGLELATPITLMGSLEIHATESPERLTLHNTSYVDQGIIAGRLRSIFRITDLVTGGSGTGRAGFVFMQNTPTIFQSLDRGYGVFLSGANGLTARRLSIVKFTNSFPALPIELASTTVFSSPPNLNEDFLLEAEWLVDLGILGGIRIFVGYALGKDPENLTRILTYVDTTSPIITSSFESLAFTFDGTGAFRVLCDETHIFNFP